MSYQTKFAGADFVSRAAELLRQKGISLHVGTDFNEYADTISKYRPEQPLAPPYDPRVHDMSQANGFWIVGRNEEGALVHTQALRLIDLNSQSLADYMANNFRAFCPVGVDLDLAASQYNPGPGAHQIKGRVCYHGDFWLKGGPDGYRGTGASSVLARYALGSSLMTWSPDFVFGFMAQPVAFRGLAVREGYMHTEPGALEWHLAESDNNIKGYMVYMSRDDLDFILDISIKDLVA